MLDNLIKTWINKILKYNVVLKTDNNKFGYIINIVDRYKPTYSIYLFPERLSNPHVLYNLNNQIRLNIQNEIMERHILVDFTTESIVITCYLDKFIHKYRLKKLNKIIKNV